MDWNYILIFIAPAAVWITIYVGLKRSWGTTKVIFAYILFYITVATTVFMFFLYYSRMKSGSPFILSGDFGALLWLHNFLLFVFLIDTLYRHEEDFVKERLFATYWFVLLLLLAIPVFDIIFPVIGKWGKNEKNLMMNFKIQRMFFYCLIGISMYMVVIMVLKKKTLNRVGNKNLLYRLCFKIGCPLIIILIIFRISEYFFPFILQKQLEHPKFFRFIEIYYRYLIPTFLLIPVIIAFSPVFIAFLQGIFELLRKPLRKTTYSEKKHNWIIQLINRKYHKASFGDFIVLYGMLVVSVISVFFYYSQRVVPIFDVVEELLRNRLALLVTVASWLKGGEWEPADIPINAYIVPLYFYYASLIALGLIYIYGKNWGESIMNKIKHHKLRDKPFEMELRNHTIILGDPFVIKEIVKEFIEMDRYREITKNFVLVSDNIRDVQFVLAVNANISNKLWVIEGDLIDVDAAKLANVEKAKEIAIFYRDLELKAKRDSILSFIMNASLNNPHMQICAIFQSRQYVQEAKWIRTYILSQINKTQGDKTQDRESQKLELDFFYSLEELREKLHQLIEHFPGITGVFLDVFSGRNLGPIDFDNKGKDIDIVRINENEKERYKIAFTIAKGDRKFHYGVNGFSILEEGKRHLEKVQVKNKDDDNRFILTDGKIEQEFQRVRCGTVQELMHTIRVFIEQEDAKLNLHIIFEPKEEYSPALLETLLSSIRKMSARNPEKWESIILDIVDPTLLAIILLAYGLIFDAGNALFTYMVENPSENLGLFLCQKDHIPSTISENFRPIYYLNIKLPQKKVASAYLIYGIRVEEK